MNKRLSEQTPQPGYSSPGEPDRHPQPRGHALARAILLTLVLSLAPAGELLARSTAKGEVFEAEFLSTRPYQNPPQEARLTADFISPDGRTNRVHGFWLGGLRWAVRFSPDQLGHWTYTTECSDSRNAGLHRQSGALLCRVQSLRTDLQHHGRLAVSRDGRTFQHTDGTPFFWTADTVWDGPRQATRQEWSEYAKVRSQQGFNVALCRVAPGTDNRGRSAYSGWKRIELHPGMLQTFDERVTWLANSDMVSAIAPLWEIGVRDEDLLPEDQVIVLLRQLVGRWDARPVAWVIAFEADTAGRRAARWRRIGRSVFDGYAHAPVILSCGSSHWALKEFARESWVDALAVQSGNDVSEEATLWLARGPLATLWMHEPARPLLNLRGAGEADLAPDGRRVATAQTLEALARSLFVAPPAGLCYQSRAVAAWDAALDTNTVAVTGEAMSEWRKSLHLPGAARVGQIRHFMEETAFHELLPASYLLAPIPQNQAAPRPLSALASPRRDQALFFVPEGATLSLRAHALRSGLEPTFFSLRTGLRSPSEPLTADNILTFSPPDAGDWLLRLAPATE
ncbi:MAG: DUF4038 domain-containing protein [Verrucomicrobia bacterium]|jgi:hypothetical protein|nr:DUF4038 domain-containing protein [Verrucomicrobiota bacterium]